ncbi:hypothetical protein SEVIR_7G062900v4 [Setaria viridis]
MRIAPLPAEQGVSLFFNPAPPATLSFPSTIAQPNRAPPHARFVAPAPPPPSPSCLDLRLHSKLTDGRTRPRRPRGADLPRALHMEDCCTVQPNVFVSLGLMSWCFNTCGENLSDFFFQLPKFLKMLFKMRHLGFLLVNLLYSDCSNIS